MDLSLPDWRARWYWRVRGDFWQESWQSKATTSKCLVNIPAWLSSDCWTVGGCPAHLTSVRIRLAKVNNFRLEWRVESGE